MKRFLSFNFACALLLLLGVFVAACSTEFQTPERESGAPRAFNLSLKVDLGTPEQYSFGEDEDGRPTRAASEQTISLLFEVKNSTAKQIDGSKDSEFQKTADLNRTLVIQRHPKLKFLTVIRAKNRKEQVYYDFSEWTYNEVSQCWEMENLSIPLTAGFRMTDDIEIRVATGGHIKVAEDQKSATIDMPTDIYKQVNFAVAASEGEGANNPTALEYPVPYISDWADLTYDEGNLKMVLASGANGKITLNPQGILMLATVRNNLNQDIKMSGIYFKSNALEYGGTFKLNEDNVTFTGDDTNILLYSNSFIGDTYKGHKYMFSSPLTLKKKMGSSVDETIILTWAYPLTEKFRSPYIAGGTKDAQRAGNVHVYAEGVTALDGTPITKPNFDIVPIMGTAQKLISGNSYTFNCEIYEQPNMLLGYFAKYTVKADGTGFDTSHDDASSSLVSWKHAKDFVLGKQLTTNGANPITATYKMIPYSGAVLLGYGWGAWGSGDYMAAVDGNGDQNGWLGSRSGSMGNGQRVMGYGYNGYTRPGNYFHQTYLRPDKTIGYRISNIGSATPKLNRFIDQTVWRVEFDSKNGNLGVPKKYSCIYLGKFFCGNLFTPIYREQSLSDEALWSSELGRRNIVERIYPNPGKYTTVTANDLDNDAPANTTRERVGEPSLLWAISEDGASWRNNLMMYYLEQENATYKNYTATQWVDFIVDKLTEQGPSNTVNAVLTSSTLVKSNWGLSKNANSVYPLMFMGLITYSNTYQGDTAD